MPAQVIRSELKDIETLLFADCAVFRILSMMLDMLPIVTEACSGGDVQLWEFVQL